MKTSKVGALDVRRVVKDGPTEKDDGKAPLTCVLLHGFGAPGDDLVGLSDGLDLPAGTELVFPEALHALQDFISQPLYGDARAWWMIDFAAMERAIARGETRDLSKQVPDGLVEAREAVTTMLDALSGETKDRRLVIGGFSQGAMLSLDVALRQPERKLAGIVQLSGTMLAESEWTPLMSARKGMKVFQSHGETDAILPFSIAERLRGALQNAGLDVTFDPFRGPHTIAPRTLDRLSGWLRALD